MKTELTPRQKAIEQMKFELEYAILLNDLDIRQLRLKLVDPEYKVEKKQMDEIVKATAIKEAEEKYITKRLNLLHHLQ